MLLDFVIFNTEIVTNYKFFVRAMFVPIGLVWNEIMPSNIYNIMDLCLLIIDERRIVRVQCPYTVMNKEAQVQVQ